MLGQENRVPFGMIEISLAERTVVLPSGLGQRLPDWSA
jgi:hypothetical protein